jgi:hypothetical protein
MTLRQAVWLILAGLTILLCFVYGQVADRFDSPSYWRIWLFPPIGAMGIAMVFLAPSLRSIRSIVLVIWIPALLMRLVLLPAACSDDMNRYLWEGKLVAEGLSPYAERGDAGIWEPYRDDYWEAMNHKDKATAYPPLIEWIFGGIAAIAYHPLAFKLVFVAADLLTLGGILVLLRQRGLSPGYAGFYAFNPIVLLSFAGEGHFDSLMIAALVWALVAHGVGRFGWAVTLAALATGIKWVTLPLIPFFAGGRLVRGAVIALVTLLLPALFFWNSLPQLIEGLLQFGGTRSFNGPIYERLLGYELPRGPSSIAMAVIFAGLLLWRWLQREVALDVHIRWILGGLIVLSPTVHFWYVAWLLPFVCLRPSMPWLMFSLSGGAYFYVWVNAAAGTWELEKWQQGLFWGPFFVALLYELWSTRGRVLFPHRRVVSREDSIAVVLPTFNVAERLPRAFESIRSQTCPPKEILVVDAGSSDGTLGIIEDSDLAVRVIPSERGRGQQIATGIEAARADWVVVLHADAELNPDSLEQIRRAVQAQPDVVGGALGQRFEATPAALLPIEWLNDLRALFSRTAFGDQTQFFHRETALARDLMPRQPLMEDVESSWRIRECAAFCFLNQPTTVCHRKWRPHQWCRRFALVLRLVTRYRSARLRGRAAAEALSHDLYQEYYGN